TDAIGGTYVAALKARREWGGEALNRATTISVPVGPAATDFVAKTGGCNACHTGASAFASVLHGISDRRGRYACHASLAIEPDAHPNSLDLPTQRSGSRRRRTVESPVSAGTGERRARPPGRGPGAGETRGGRYSWIECALLRAHPLTIASATRPDRTGAPHGD